MIVSREPAGSTPSAANGEGETAHPTSSGVLSSGVLSSGVLWDSHLHMADFRQRFASVDVLIDALDRAGVAGAVVFGMQIKQAYGRDEPVPPAYYLDNDADCYWATSTDARLFRQLASLDSASKPRILPYICGINPTDLDCVDYLHDFLEQHRGWVAGIGELLLRHGHLTHKLTGEKPRADHVALRPVFDLAGQFGLPVLVHNDISSPRCGKPKYVGEMRKVCQQHPDTRIVWAHGGVNRDVRVDHLPWILGSMLVEYPNLTVDLSWDVLWEQELRDPEREHPSLRDDWRNLIEEFPTRFVIGSDAVGHNGLREYSRLSAGMNWLLDELTPATARCVASDNLCLLHCSALTSQVSG